MLVTDGQRKTIGKLLEKISFSELTIQAPNNGDKCINLIFRGGPTVVEVKLNEYGRKA